MVNTPSVYPLVEECFTKLSISLFVKHITNLSTFLSFSQTFLSLSPLLSLFLYLYLSVKHDINLSLSLHYFVSLSISLFVKHITYISISNRSNTSLTFQSSSVSVKHVTNFSISLSLSNLPSSLSLFQSNFYISLPSIVPHSLSLCSFYFGFSQFFLKETKQLGQWLWLSWWSGCF